MGSMMKQVILLPLVLMLVACGVYNYDDVAYRQVVVTSPPPLNHNIFATNRESTDVTCTHVKYHY